MWLVVLQVTLNGPLAQERPCEPGHVPFGGCQQVLVWPHIHIFMANELNGGTAVGSVTELERFLLLDFLRWNLGLLKGAAQSCCAA